MLFTKDHSKSGYQRDEKTRDLVELTWSPGHRDIKGNKYTDK